MTNVYIFAPTKTHSHSVVLAENLNHILANVENVQYKPLSFQDTVGNRFEDGDFVLIRGLKSWAANNDESNQDSNFWRELFRNRE